MLTPGFGTLTTGKVVLPFTATGNTGEMVFQDDYKSSIVCIDSEVPGDHQFVQQFVANLTLQSKENITAKDRKSEELVGISVKIGLPACSIKKSKKKKKNPAEAFTFEFPPPPSSHLKEVWRQEVQGW